MATAQITITDKEKEEFDTITYDKICSLKDVEKLRRCEHYMRQEGFPQTADAVRARLQQLGSSALGEMSEDERTAVSRELDSFLSELSAWELDVKKADGQLRDKKSAADGDSGGGGGVRHLPNDAARAERGVVQGDGDQPRNAREVVDKANRKRAESKAKAGRRAKDVRSGGEYYREWDRIADQALMESGSSDEEDAEAATPTAAEEVSDPDIKLAERLIRTSENVSAPAAEDPSLSRIRRTAAEKVLKSLEGAPQVERSYQARIEKEKGNEYFRAKEYSAAVDAYTLSLQLQPNVAAVHTNRSMAYFKLKRWEDAETDGTFALDIDPSFVKGYVRRGTARMEMGNYAGAVEDFTKALELVPGDREIEAYLSKAQRKLDAERKPKMRPMAVEEVEEGGDAGANGSEGANANVAPAEQPPATAATTPPPQASTQPTAHRPADSTGPLGPAPGPAAVFTPASATTKPVNGAPPGATAAEPAAPVTATVAPQQSAEPKAKPPPAKGEAPAAASPGAGASIKGGHAATRKERADKFKERGNELFKRAKYEEAEKCYTQCLAWDPGNVPALNNRGVCRLKMQDYVGAELDCSKVLDVDPQNIKALHRRASARYELERIPEALADVDTLTQLMPEDHPAANEVEKLAEQIHRRAYVPKRTGKMVIKEVDSDDEPDDATARRQLEEAKHEMRRAALEQAAQAAVVAELQKEAGARAAELEDSLQRKDKAERELEAHTQRLAGGDAMGGAATQDAAAPVAPGRAPEGSAASVAASEAEKERGNELFKKGWFDDAIGCYSRSLDLRPGNAAVLSNRAMCYLKLERWKEAEADAARSIATDPHFFKGYHRRAVALRNLGRLEEALQDYQVVLKHAHNNKAVLDEVSQLHAEMQQRAARDASSARASGGDGGASQAGVGAARAQPQGTKIVIQESEGSSEEEDEDDDEDEDDTDDERWAREAAAAVAAAPTGKPGDPGRRKDGGEGVRVPEAAGTPGADGSPSVLKGSYAVAAEAAKEAVLQKMMASLPVPKSSSEFEKACQVFKGDNEAMANYLQRVPVDQYRKIFGDSLTPPVIASIIHALRGGYMPGKPAGAAAVLQSLASVNRFATTVMLLSRSDKAVLAELFDQLLASGVGTVDIPALRKTFRV